MKNKLLFLVSMMLFLTASAQDMATTFRSEGKIYVVIAVAGVVLAGIFVYLFAMDSRLRTLEKEIKQRSEDELSQVKR